MIREQVPILVIHFAMLSFCKGFVQPFFGPCGLLLVAPLVFSFVSVACGQAYVVEIEGTWTTTADVYVREGWKVRAGTKLTNTSGNANDHVSLVDEDGKVVVRATCVNGCPIVTVPTTKSWGGYFYCLLIKCGSTRYSTSGTRNDCDNPDFIVKRNSKGLTDLGGLLSLVTKESSMKISFHHRAGESVFARDFDVNTDSPMVAGLTAGVIYEVTIDRRTSRVLVLGAAAYNRRSKSLSRLRQKIISWRNEGLSNCTIKGFTKAYIDHVAWKEKKRSGGRIQRAGRTF